MMRRGELGEFPVEWVLRTAAEERLSGGIEFHAGTTVCVHLADGGVYLALVEGEARPEAEGPEGDDEEEARARRHTVGVLADLLAAEEGWYFFHPLNHHALHGAWLWEVDDLLGEARPRPTAVPEVPDEPLAPPAPVAPAGPVVLASHPPVGPLSDEAWAVVAALALPADPAELADRTGWDRDRLDRVLDAMAAAGVLGPSAPEVAAPAVSASPGRVDGAPPSAASAAEGDASRRLGLRRLIRTPRVADAPPPA